MRVAQHAHHPPHRVHRLRAGLLDLFQGEDHPLRILLGDEPRALCLNHDSRDVVGDEVMQFPGELGALLGPHRDENLLPPTVQEPQVGPTRARAGHAEGDEERGYDVLVVGDTAQRQQDPGQPKGQNRGDRRPGRPRRATT